MSDYLVEFARRPWARKMVRALGLPLPMPATLARGEGAIDKDLLRDLHAVALGGPGGELHPTLAEAMIGGAANLHYVGGAAHFEAYREMGARYDRPVTRGQLAPDAQERQDVLMFDASGLEHPAELRSLYDAFHPRIRDLARCGRVIVVARPPEERFAQAEAAAVASGLEGFVRSVAKEIGGKGSTAQLVYVASGSEGRARALLQFLASRRSAFVSGQPFRVDGRVAGDSGLLDAQSLDGKNALVTGAARGIGAAIAATLAREGAHVMLLDREEDDSPLESVAGRIGGNALHCDLTAPDAPRMIAERVRSRFGALDIVVHNAGITRDKTLANMKAEAWEQVIDVNLSAITRMTPVLLESGMHDGGRIVCMSSISGLAGNFGQSNYATAKAAVAGYVRALATKVHARGITVNAVAPGFIETRMTRHIPVHLREVSRRLSALSQGGEPADVAEVVAFLASPNAVGITGQVVRVCGLNFIGA